MSFLFLLILDVFALGVNGRRRKNDPSDNIYHEGWIDFNKNGVMDVFEDVNANIDERVENLLSLMTLEEKTCQCATLYGSGRVLADALPTAAWDNEVWKDGIGNIDEEHNGLGTFGTEYSFPYSKHVETLHTIQRWFVENTRLGIPVDFTNEGIRGLNHDRATLFPSQSGQGSTWDRNLISRIAEVEAEEAVALGYTNIYSPIMDIAQDPRWGRVVESYGEDPYLVGELGKRMVMGLQSHRLVSTLKHFAVYSVPVGGRDGKTRTDPHVAEREMRTLYMETFRKGIQEGGAMGVMSSYNDYNGDPITGSTKFLTDILRKELGFNGYVVSDSEAVEFLMTKHKVVETYVDAVALAVNAGLNIRTHFTPPKDYILPLREAVARGKVSVETLDSRVRDILRVKFWLGLFDDPYRGDGPTADAIVHSASHQSVSLQAARESLVLLKNENNTFLPWPKTYTRLLVVGPNANESTQFVCRYGPANARIKTVYQGLKEFLPNATVVYKKGCEIYDPNFPESELYAFPKTEEERDLMDEAIKAASDTQAIIVVLGGSELTVREERSRTSLNLPGRQEELLQAMLGTGKPVLLVLLDGRAASINWAQAHVPAILHNFFPGEFLGNSVAEAIFGEYNPGGKLAVTFPKSVGQIPFAFPFKPGSDESSYTSVYGALYPFGFGLSYTTFAYSALRISPQRQCIGGNVTVTVNVKNTGKVLGDEVVQLYIHDEVSSVTRYTKELRGFERIPLQPGEEKTVSFVLTPQELGLWNKEMRFEVEPGWFTVFVGASSQDIRLEGRFESVNDECGTTKY